MHRPEPPPENSPQEPGREPSPPTDAAAPAEPSEVSAPAEASTSPAPAEPAEIPAPATPAEIPAPGEPSEIPAPAPLAEIPAPAEPSEIPAPTEPAAPAASADGGSPEAPAPAQAGAPEPRPEPWWPRLALPIGTLMTAAFSITLAIQTAALKSRQDLFVNNTFGTSGAPGRRIVLITLGVAALLPLIGALALAIWKRARSVRPLDLTSRIACPLVLSALIPSLFSAPFSQKSALGYLAMLAVVALTLPPLLERSFEAIGEARRSTTRKLPFGAPRIPNWVYFALVVVAASAYAAYFGYFTLLNHKRLGTSGFDLGIYDNLMFNAMKGHPFEAPVLFGPKGGNYISGHAEFAMLLFVPIYAIAPGPENLLIVQAVLLGFAAVPLYLFASTQISRPASVVVALAYLFFAPLHGPNFYDFHWLPLAVFFHFWLYYGIATRKTWLIVLMVAILFAIREDVAVGTAVLGVFLLLTGLRPRLGVILTLLSVAWFALVRFYIMPKAGEWFFHNLYNKLFADGSSSFTSVIRTILTNPVYFGSTLLKETKLIFALHMLAPLAFVPCRRVPLLLLLLPGFFFTLMTTDYPPTVSIAFQYTTHWIPYLFLGIVLAIVMMEREQVNGLYAKRAALFTIALCVISHSYNFGAVLERSNFIGGFSRIHFKITPVELERYHQLKELAAMIPREASVAASDQELPHVSTRRTTYHIHGSIGDAEYMLIGKSHINPKVKAVLTKVLPERQWGLVAQRGDELYLFKKGHASPETKAAKKALGFPEK